MEHKKELNERQKRLYYWLIHVAFARPNEYVSKEEIAYAFSEQYPRHLENSSEHNSRAFNLIRQDVRAINFSDVEKIIVSSPYGYKIATKEEAQKYIKRRLKSSLVSLKLYWNIKRKMDKNGQLDMNLQEVEAYIEA